ncbi:hypothetical protein CBR_g104 [Chara braunii]|uniref:Uncharacterized protein n=1 Tax=Chara braunii TaxID=69332 RepID=A0A388JLS8_CHABU|nr:hypothetical protein CBR_g104 [Chara braunii]|eukprot:GBG58703.1 hypothetical protein CBR_g104 [Chara braunii]
MNLKFELVKEAEENFEAELPMRLGNEVLRIKFVCKHTPWCDRCRWWFHISTDGCPRADEDDSEDQAGQHRTDNHPSRQQRSSGDCHIRDAAREVPSQVHGSREVLHAGEEGSKGRINMCESSIHNEGAASSSQPRLRDEPAAIRHIPGAASQHPRQSITLGTGFRQHVPAGGLLRSQGPGTYQYGVPYNPYGNYFGHMYGIGDGPNPAAAASRPVVAGLGGTFTEEPRDREVVRQQLSEARASGRRTNLDPYVHETSQVEDEAEAVEGDDASEASSQLPPERGDGMEASPRNIQ